MTAEIYLVYTLDAHTLEVSSITAENEGFVDLDDGRTTHRLDLVAARRLARVLLQAAEDAEQDVVDVNGEDLPGGAQ